MYALSQLRKKIESKLWMALGLKKESPSSCLISANSAATKTINKSNFISKEVQSNLVKKDLVISLKKQRSNRKDPVRDRIAKPSCCYLLRPIQWQQS